MSLRLLRDARSAAMRELGCGFGFGSQLVWAWRLGGLPDTFQFVAGYTRRRRMG